MSLFEHLESGCPLDEFLENFSSVSRAAAVAVIMGAQALTLETAFGTGPAAMRPCFGNYAIQI